MNKKQLYESIMSSIAKQVKRVLNEGKRVGKYEFSHEDLEEIKEFMLQDEDFYECFCTCANFEYYDSYEGAVADFIDFLENDIYDSYQFPDSEVHAWYILDEPDLGTAWAELKSGKIANIDNIYTEFKSIISQ